jgi:hypothetical protein
MTDARELIGTADVLMVTFDSLRYDVACTALAGGATPSLAAVLPEGRWEQRRTPGSFTLPAHLSFFSGFLPVPLDAQRRGRLFACQGRWGKTVTETTYVFDDVPNIVEGLGRLGYRTICIGGVGFFSKTTELGRVLPGMFQDSYWSPDTGVNNPASTELQVDLAEKVLAGTPPEQRVFLFVNVSATHEPHHMYLPGAGEDSIDSQAAALAYADRHVGRLMTMMRERGRCLAILCADHGTAFGEDGYWGHGVPHPVVWTVPYAELVLT